MEPTLLLHSDAEQLELVAETLGKQLATSGTIDIILEDHQSAIARAAQVLLEVSDRNGTGALPEPFRLISTLRRSLFPNLTPVTQDVHRLVIFWEWAVGLHLTTTRPELFGRHKPNVRSWPRGKQRYIPGTPEEEAKFRKAIAKNKAAISRGKLPTEPLIRPGRIASEFDELSEEGKAAWINGRTETWAQSCRGLAKLIRDILSQSALGNPPSPKGTGRPLDEVKAKCVAYMKELKASGMTSPHAISDAVMQKFRRKYAAKTVQSYLKPSKQKAPRGHKG